MTDYYADEPHDGLRLDVFLAGEIEDASRSYIQKVIKSKGVTIGGTRCKRPSRTINKGETISLELPPPPEASLEPEDIPLDILHEDDDVIVINKPSGLVVHPAPGHYSGTLVNAVIHHCGPIAASLEDSTRPGIVHRLDRQTSGVMVVAKTPTALRKLSQQAHDHTFDRRYVALVQGEFEEDTGKIIASVGRSIANPGKMAVTGVRGRDAVTNYKVIDRYGVATLVRLVLETGRTHQIRVHMRFAGRPILGDPLYGVSDFSSWPESLQAPLSAIDGQALHAELLGFTHPTTNERMTFEAPMPEDMAAARQALQAQV